MQLIDLDPDPLSAFLGKLLIKTDKLQAKCKALEEMHTQLEKDCTRLMTEDRQNLLKTMTEALGSPYVPGAASLQGLKKQIEELRKSNTLLEAERLTLTKKNAALANENAALSKQILASIQKLQNPREEN